MSYRIIHGKIVIFSTKICLEPIELYPVDK
jgi:hypothetical protein